MKQKKWATGVTAVIMVLMLLAGYMAIAAELGSQDDPLVTLGYITDELQPYIMAQVDQTVKTKTDEFSLHVDQEIDRFSALIDERIASLGAQSIDVTDQAFIDAVADAVIAKMGENPQPSASAQSAAFVKVEIANGKTVIGDLGTEILLRLGTANCVTPGETGLIDLTDASTLSNGKPLVKNHLYIVTITERGFKATSNTTVFIRGGYVIK